MSSSSKSSSGPFRHSSGGRSRRPSAPKGRPRPPATPPQKLDASAPAPDKTWVVPTELHRRPLDGVVRALAESTWSEARQLVASGKIAVEGDVVTDGLKFVRGGDRIELRLRAPKPRTTLLRTLETDLIVHLEAAFVVVRKPAGVSTVPFGDESPEEANATLDALVRDVLARRDHIRGRAPIGVVQRLDKATSGLLVFARTLAAKKHLGQQLRAHTMHRRYLAIAHGDVKASTIRSYIAADRGDGRRGSASDGRREGQLAITHVEPLERLRGATLVSCRLETGRTHQIRIHLSESGHPLVGEAVYVRDFRGTPIEAPRLMLHAAELGFEHPTDERPMHFTEPPPADFNEVLARLRLSP